MNNILEEIDEGYRWEAERKRRLRYHRRMIIREAIRANRLFVAFCVAATLGFFAFMLTWNGCIQPLNERAAYIEGRYGVDHDTALAMAKAESEVR